MNNLRSPDTYNLKDQLVFPLVPLAVGHANVIEQLQDQASTRLPEDLLQGPHIPEDIAYQDQDTNSNFPPQNHLICWFIQSMCSQLVRRSTSFNGRPRHPQSQQWLPPWLKCNKGAAMVSSLFIGLPLLEGVCRILPKLANIKLNLSATTEFA